MAIYVQPDKFKALQNCALMTTISMTHTMTNLRQAFFLALRKHALNAVGAVMVILMAHLLRKQGITLGDIGTGVIAASGYIAIAMSVEYYLLRKARPSF